MKFKNFEIIEIKSSVQVKFTSFQIGENQKLYPSEIHEDQGK